MAFIASWILKMLREVSYPPQEENDQTIYPEKIFLKYNEEEAFYIFCYIMDELKWSLIFEPSMERIMTYITNFEAVISGGYFELAKHIMNENSGSLDLYTYFGSVLTSLFVRDLQVKYPQTLMHIFDVFLLDGEEVILQLLI
jgi:hypothetical protein